MRRCPYVLKFRLKPIPRSERPWRQRMADAARLRDFHGDASPVAARLADTRARRSSIERQSGDELQSSINALKNFVGDSSVDKVRSARCGVFLEFGPFEISLEKHWHG